MPPCIRSARNGDSIRHLLYSKFWHFKLIRGRVSIVVEIQKAYPLGIPNNLLLKRGSTKEGHAHGTTV